MKKIKDNRIGIVEVVKRIGISQERMRYWEIVGAVKPKYVQCGTRRFRRYSKEDIERAILIKKLIDEEKYTLEGAVRKIKSNEKNY